MKSKKKINKQNILIVYNKGIASIQGIELAMLFCHAGFSVKTILLDGAEEYISSELLKEITGHTPWYNSHKPNWVKAEIEYPVGIVFDEKITINPPLTKGGEEKTTQSQHCSAMLPPIPTVFDCQPLQSLASPNPASPPFVGQHLRDNFPTIHGGASECENDDITSVIGGTSYGMFVDYIKEHCGFIKILVNKESAFNHNSNDLKKQIILLPDNPLNLRKLFEKILSEIVVLASSKALDGEITYSFEGDFSKIDYINDLEKAFAEAGIEKISLTDYLTVVSPLRLATQSTSPNQRFGEDLSKKKLPHSWRSCHEVTEGAAHEVSGSNDDVVAVVSSRNKRIEIFFEANEDKTEPTKNRIYISKHKNGLILTDSIETRLLPHFSCQSCYSRLVSYLKTELTRN